jgi:hypothetical protein
MFASFIYNLGFTKKANPRWRYYSHVAGIAKLYLRLKNQIYIYLNDNHIKYIIIDMHVGVKPSYLQILVNVLL